MTLAVRPWPPDGRPAASELVLLEKSQAVLELSRAELELLELAAGDQAQLTERAGKADPRPLADALRVAAPARREIADELSRLVGAHAAAPGELLDELLDPLARERHRADRREHEPLGRVAERTLAASGLVHAASSAAAAAGDRASTPPPAGRRARTWAPARPAPARCRRRRPAPAPRPHARPPRESASPAAGRT